MKQIDFVVIALCAIAALMIGYQAASSFAEAPGPTPAVPTPYYIAAQGQPTVTPFSPPALATAIPTREISLKLPAVTSSDKGILAELVVTAKQGTGQIFISFSDSNPIIMNDTQVSMRTAIEFAKQFAGVNSLEETNRDYFFKLLTPSEAVSGKSSGAATAIATIALLKGDRLRNDTLLTGTILADGKIGPVGKVLYKAQAVKDAGYTVFLVPTGESTATSTSSVENRSCTQEFMPGSSEPVESCTIVGHYTVTNTVNVSEQVGIAVIEVADIAQAYALMKAS